MTSRRLDFEKLPNTRDLGGMRTADGRTVAEGKLIRSGQLAGLSESDIVRLSELIDAIADFRTEEEKTEDPDCDIPGAAYHYIPILEAVAAGVSHEAESEEQVFARLVFDPEASGNHMCDMYRKFAESDYSVSQYARFIRLLLEDHDRAVLWHCSVGKDRAGTATVIILKILGVSDEDIIRDYLDTNGYLKDELDRVIAYARMKTGSDDPRIESSVRKLYSTDRAYLQSFLDAVDRRFGSFGEYVHEGLGLSDSDIRLLKEKYLV